MEPGEDLGIRLHNHRWSAQLIAVCKLHQTVVLKGIMNRLPNLYCNSLMYDLYNLHYRFPPQNSFSSLCPKQEALEEDAENITLPNESSFIHQTKNIENEDEKCNI